MPAGATVAVIGLGGVGLSCVMGAVLANAAQIVAIDRVASKLDVARDLGATHGLVATDDRAADLEALRDLTDGGPDFVFEAIGRVSTVELAIESLPVGGTAMLVGLTAFESRASFGVYPLVDGARRILGSNYGSADPAVDFPRYAALHLAGEPDRPAHRPPDRSRRPRGRVRSTANRAGAAPGRGLRVAGSRVLRAESGFFAALRARRLAMRCEGFRLGPRVLDDTKS